MPTDDYLFFIDSNKYLDLYRTASGKFLPRGSSRQGQSDESRTMRSSSRISAPYFTARRAKRYAPDRLHSSQRKRTRT
jgi:hypothetical protein